MQVVHGRLVEAGKQMIISFSIDCYMKLQHVCSACTVKLRFESSVISQGYKTFKIFTTSETLFESSVISQGYKTYYTLFDYHMQFESSVISQGYKTETKNENKKAPFESSVISQEYKMNGFAK